MRQVLENNAGHRALLSKRALGNLPDADKASDKAVFGKTREVIIDEVRGKLGKRLANNIANNIANALKLKSIKANREPSNGGGSDASTTSRLQGRSQNDAHKTQESQKMPLASSASK